jgi:hypothetical protein
MKWESKWDTLVYVQKTTKNTNHNLHQKNGIHGTPLLPPGDSCLPAPGGNLYLPDPVAWRKRHNEDSEFGPKKTLSLTQLKRLKNHC